MKYLIKELMEEGILKTPSIIDAFEKVDRKDFVLEELKDKAYLNTPLPIGYGPGWQTALLAHVVSVGGKIFAAELIPELMDFGRKNVAKYGFIKNKTVEFHSLNAAKGMPEEAPFDRIISAASGMELPAAWKEQLKIGGRIVAPVKDAIHLLIKKGPSAGEAGVMEFEESIYSGFAFVPLVSLNEDI